MEIYERILNVMNETKKVIQTGHNKFQGYKYLKYEDILTAIRSAMIKNGVLYYNSVLEEHLGSFDTKKGKMNWTRIKVKHTFTDGKDKIEFDNWGYGSDNGDKAVYCAMTGAKKYAYTTMLMLADGIEGESTDPENDKPEPTPPPTKAPVNNQGGFPADWKKDDNDPGPIAEDIPF